MNYSLASLKGVILGILYGTTIAVIEEETRSLDNATYGTHEIVESGVVFLPGTLNVPLLWGVQMPRP